MRNTGFPPVDLRGLEEKHMPWCCCRTVSSQGRFEFEANYRGGAKKILGF